jgi:site-specific DNA-methyltransferase (adenine-specific)
MKETNRGKQMKSVWEIRPPESWEKRFGKHPTQKPVALLERILLASTNEGDLVLDPFCGSGTTALAAMRTKRIFRGIEIDSKWIRVSVQRIREQTGGQLRIALTDASELELRAIATSAD